MANAVAGALKMVVDVAPGRPVLLPSFSASLSLIAENAQLLAVLTVVKPLSHRRPDLKAH